MKTHNKATLLFAAFSRVASRAFLNAHMVSCHVLSKAPNYDDILRRYILSVPIRPVSFLHRVDLTLRHYALNAAHVASLLLAKIALHLSGWSAPSALMHKKSPLLVIDTFLIVPKVIERKRYTELYLPGLAEEAERCGQKTLHLFRLYGTRDPRKLYQAFCIMRDSQIQGLTELHLFTWRDWLSLFVHWLVYPFVHWSVIASLKDSPSGSPESYIRDSLIHCLPQCYMIGEGRRLAAKRLAALISPKTTDGVHIVSWYENQTVNKAFYLGLREAERTNGIHIPTTGTQLFLWPDVLLNNQADDTELPLGLLPDRVLVNGSYYLPEDSKQSYQVGPSLRYAELFSIGTMTPAPEKPMLVLLSYHPEETTRILQFVHDAGLDGNVVYKFHPATRVQDYAHLLPANPQCVDGSLYTALAEASLVLGSGSGSMAEAVALGIPAITVEDPLHIPGLGLNYLPSQGQGTLWESVYSPEELPKIIERLKGASQQPGRDKELENFRSLLFTEPTSECINKAFTLTKNTR